MCDSHIDALSSLQSAISRGFNTDSLRALPKLYIEHSFITENKADNLLSDIPVIREFNTESQVKLNHRLSLMTNYLLTQNQSWVPWYTTVQPFSSTTTTKHSQTLSEGPRVDINITHKT